MVKETTTQVEPSAGDDEHDDPSPKTPKFFNAFEFISSMLFRFDLSSLFEKKRKVGSIFTSKCRVAVILAKIDAMAKGGEASGGGLTRVGAERRVGVGVRRDSWKGIRWGFWRIGFISRGISIGFLGNSIDHIVLC
jgi:hypothetical protein